MSAERNTLLVVPEPVDWLAPLRPQLESLGSLEVFAPWALPPRTPRALTSAHDFFGRRVTPDAPAQPWFPAFTAFELGIRSYARDKAARQFAGRFVTRAAVDRLVAAALRGGRWPGLSRVVAPSLCARRTFAAARARGMQCVLLEDAPDLLELSHRLDEQAARHPECPFLRNHRPKRRLIVDQRAERELAHAIGVRGAYGWDRLEARAGNKLFGLAVPLPAPTAAVSMPGTVLLAGPPVGRSGTMHLHALADRLPNRRFIVAGGPDVEPHGLFDHPRVHQATRVERERFEPAVILSLTSVESHPWEVRRAIGLGRPIVGTAQSLGQVEAASVRIVSGEDLDGIEAAIRAATAHPMAPLPWKPARTLHGRLAS